MARFGNGFTGRHVPVSYTHLYDAQNREIWSLNCKRPFGVSSSERKVYSGSKMTWYSTTCGVKTVSYTEYDEQGRITVSYTHLDVYKRQALTRTATYSSSTARLPTSTTKLFRASLRSTWARSVSYTHLDVYKRQQEGRHQGFHPLVNHPFPLG